MTVRRTLTLVTAAVTLLALAPLAPAGASGSPNRWENAQVGLTYTGYRPTTTLGLARSQFQLNDCGQGRDEMLNVSYGSQQAQRWIGITESQRGCVDGPDGVGPAGTFTVRGATATILGDCPGGRASCSTATGAGVRRSAYTTVTLPSGGAGLGSTFVEVYTQGLSKAQIAQVVRGLVSASP